MTREEFIAIVSQPKREHCPNPNCGAQLPHGQCMMTYTIWNCLMCGAHIDSRVSRPQVYYGETAV